MSSKSSRTITKQQFSDGTTIDGNRLDEAMGDIQRRFNSIPKGDIKERWLQRQIVLGFWPAQPYEDSGDFVSNYPFVRSYNELKHMQGPLGELNVAEIEENDPTDYVIRNPYRVKGIKGRNTDETTDGIVKTYTSTYIFPRPIRLDGLCIISHRDTIGFQDFFRELLDEYWSVVVSLDHPYATENRLFNQKLIAKNFFGLGIKNDKYTIPIAVSTDMLPAYELYIGDTTEVQGTFVRMDDLNIPIPQNARMRMMITCKDNRKIHRTTFTATLTLREEVE
jgi:hypothetical protein